MTQTAREKAYRQSDKGRLTRKFHKMLPEVRYKIAIRRAVKKKLKKGYS